MTTRTEGFWGYGLDKEPLLPLKKPLYEFSLCLPPDPMIGLGAPIVAHSIERVSIQVRDCQIAGVFMGKFW
jgi:hypothetical protein